MLRDWNFVSGKTEHKMGRMYRPRRTERKLKLYVSSIAMNLWGHDLFLQWNTQINIHPILETNHKLMHVSGENIRRYYKE